MSNIRIKNGKLMQSKDNALKAMREVYNYYDSQGEDAPEFVAEFIKTLIEDGDFWVFYHD